MKMLPASLVHHSPKGSHTGGQYCRALMFSLLLGLTKLVLKKTKSTFYRPFMRGIHQWLVDSPNKGLMWKGFPCHDVIMIAYSITQKIKCRLRISKDAPYSVFVLALYVHFYDYFLFFNIYYSDAIMTTMVSQITSLTVVYSIVY